MPKLRTAWSKLQWSLAHRGLGGTLRFALRRARLPPKPAEPARPQPHPFDERHGVDTSGLIGGGELRSGHKNDVFNTAYYGMAPSRFQRVMQYWVADQTHPALENYSFVDLGCGKGRAVMMASEFRFRVAVGVELHAALAGIAETNIAVWTEAGRAVCPVRIVCGDATEFVFPEGPCLLYLFNPFAAPVMKRLIERIEADFRGRPGMLDLIYFNPEAGELLEAHGGFELLWTGTVAMSEEDAAVDWVASAEDLCSVYRWIGR
ncbi:MAG TPA: class I SAM-dependent methyltransferase [Edaphobacter sp.]|jgi:SAM-dependent methyltransferase